VLWPGVATHLANSQGLASLDAEPGQESGPVPLQGGPRGASSLARRYPVGEAAGAPAGGPDAPGGRIDSVGLMIRLLYGTGMRIMECVRLW